MTTAPSASPPTPSAARLRLAAQPSPAPTARRIDGAWWPRSYDLASELPVLLDELPDSWGRISSVIVNGDPWPESPGRLLVANQVVRVGRSQSSRGPHTVCLLAPGRGRWDLLVVPPTATEEEARRLMADAVADPSAGATGAGVGADGTGAVEPVGGAGTGVDTAADADDGGTPPSGGDRLPRQGSEGGAGLVTRPGGLVPFGGPRSTR
jgi:hypothetical protein